MLFDYAGVMTVPVDEALRSFEHAEGVEPGSVREFIATGYAGGPDSALVEGLETGRIELGEFERALAAHLRVRPGAQAPAAEGLMRRIFAFLPRDPRMAALARRLRAAGVRTGLLTNTWGGAEDHDPAVLGQVFDVAVLSGEVGMRKPQAEIFALAAERLGLAPGDCLFVDDFESNVAAAREAGMEALRHEEASATIALLADRFGLPPE